VTQPDALLRGQGPLEKDYGDRQGVVLMELLKRNIAEVSHVSRLEDVTGICRSVYKERTLGKYEWDDPARDKEAA
jgi:hypothetical protein